MEFLVKIEGYKYLTFKYTKEDFDNLKDWMEKKEIKVLTPHNLLQSYSDKFNV